MRRLLTLTATVVAGLSLPTAAHANFFLGDPIDASGAVTAIGDLDLARDGTGAVAYLKSDGGVDHVFVARFDGGRFAAAERIDGGLAGPSSQPVIGAADNGRLMVAFVNGGVVHGVVRPAGAGFSAPVPIAGGVAPSADLSINGTGYASFTSAGDVRVARLDRRANTFTLLPQPIDVDPAREAGVGTARSKVSTSADGVGVVTWGEAGHVYARKMFNTGVSNAPQDLTPPAFEGRATTVSDLPDLDAEDDSSYAWVVWRQSFADGGTRILARRQRGTGFEDPVALDAGDEPADDPRIDLNGRGVGLAAMAGRGSRQPMAAVLERDAFGKGTRIAGPSVVGPAAVPVIGENNEGLIASVVAGGGQTPVVRVRPFSEGNSRPEVVVSRPELGPVEPAGGFDAASDRASGVVMTWLQGAPGGYQLVAGYFDRAPLSFTGFTSSRCCRPAAPRLSWQPAFDLWGAVRYQVLVDGTMVGETTDTRFQLPRPLTGPTHTWQVRAIDVRGQQKRSRARLLRIDDLRPRQAIRYRRKGRNVTVSVRGRDVDRKGHRASGVSSVVVSWGDRSKGSRGRSQVRARHRYRRSGTYPLEIITRDKAGNEAVSRRTVRIG
ncbi:MAG: hypothetical protein H0T43_09045 [Solirubrobacterales bacterium]|nr:hypothetical protein [Solirubrobacterales bacterium]